MPWPFFIPEFLKRRACRYLLHHYMGQYLGEKISLDDLSIDLYNGTGSVSNVPLDVEAINEVLEEVSAPVHVVKGYIGRVSVFIPWSSLMRDSCKVEISGLNVTVKPSPVHYGSQVSMTDSLFFSMSTSRQLAEEVLKASPEEGDEEDISSGFEGMETLAKAIETVLLKVQITLLNTTVSICHHTKDSSKENELSFRINMIEFFDEVAKAEPHEEEGDVSNEESTLPTEKEFATKILKMSGLRIELGTYDMTTTTTESLIEDVPFNNKRCGVPIACASGDVSMTVRMKQSEIASGPKLDIDVAVGAIHILLYPQQLHTLLELLTGITNEVQQSVPTIIQNQPSSVKPGRNRAIPQQAMRTIETQLMHHIDSQRKKKKAEEELLQRDPWDISARSKLSSMSESGHSTHNEVFYSFDLHSTSVDNQSSMSMVKNKFSQTTTSQPRIIHKHESVLPHVHLGDGVGLQQLSPPSSSPQNSRRHWNRQNTAHRSLSLSEHDFCRYALTLSGVTVTVLEANPIHTYPQHANNLQDSFPVSMQGSETHSTDSFSSVHTHPSTDSLSSSLEYCSLDEGGLDPGKYLDSMIDLLHGRIGRQEIKNCKDQLGRVLPADHLFLWMSTVKANMTTEGPKIDTELVVVAADLLEFLYHNEANIPDIKPISVQPLVQMIEDSKSSRPCLRLKMNSSMQSSPINKKSQFPPTTTQLEVYLIQVQVYLDITILDRLYLLLHPPHLSSSWSTTLASDLNTGSSLHYNKQLPAQDLFDHAMVSGSSSYKEQKLSIKVKSELLNISLRFPVADLSQVVRPPWYRPPLRKEVMFVDLQDLTISSSLVLPSPQRTTSTTVQLSSAKAYFSMEGTLENKVLFLLIGCEKTESDVHDELDLASIRFTVNQLEDSPLDLPSTLSLSYSDEDLDMSLPVTEPSPFSQKRELFSHLGESPGSPGGLSKELVLPATSEEMIHFESHIKTTSHFSLSISLPSLTLHIPNKTFLEKLYNRFATDLALWQPASPTAVERANARSMFYSSVDILRPAVTKDDKFKLCKSMLREENSDEDEISLGQDPISLMENTDTDQTPSPTFLSISLNIDKGNVSLALPVKTESTPTSDPVTQTRYDKEDTPEDPRLLDLSPRRTTSCSSSMYPSEMGVLTLEFKGGHICTAVNYKGENGHSQLCGSIDLLKMRHCPSTQQLLDVFSLSTDTTIPLHDVLNPWDKDNEGSGNLDDNGCLLSGRGDREPMLSIALDSRTELDNNRRIEKCAVRLNEALFEFHVSLPEHSYIKQLAEMLTLKDEPVPGYDFPTVITELHASLQHSAVQYRPVHIPTHAVLTLDSISVSSNLVTGSPLLLINVLLDQTCLFISDKQHQITNLRNDFVCVMEMGFLELALKMCNKSEVNHETSQLFTSIPDIELQCSGSEVHFMICVDSCSILRDLLLYLAENRDILQETEEEHYISYTSGDSPTATDISLNDKEKDNDKLPPSPSNLVGDLISEAMEEEDNDLRSSFIKTTESTTFSSSSIKSLTSSTGHATTLIFSSDSEGEGSQVSSRGELSKKKTTKEGNSKLTKKISDEWEIDEDDYCILTSPTTAKVGPGSVPVVKSLLKEGEQLTVVENHFPVPDEVVDQLKRPAHFPDPVMIYSLREITLVWHLYGGNDFSSSPLPSLNRRPPITASNNTVSSSKSKKGSINKKNLSLKRQQDWKLCGGVGRDHNVLVEIELNKLRIQHETYPEDTLQSSRFVFLIHDIEIRDRLTQSLINKFLYQYSTEALPRQSHANMFSLKVLLTQPETVEDTNSHMVSPIPQGLEAAIKISVLPLRLNIDQVSHESERDTFFFLYEFFQQLIPSSQSSSKQEGATNSSTENINQLHHVTVTTQSSQKDQVNTPAVIFIKSFVFYPDVPIRIDYEAKRLYSEQVGTLAGILLGLSHLDNSEITLKAITYKQGILGLNQLLDQVVAEWLQDIKTYQLPRILQGVGPLYHVTQLFQGVVDLLWLPVQQYQEDGRIVWGLQRGTTSFASSTGIAVVELTNRALYSVQSLAQTAFDMISPEERRSSTEITNGHVPQSGPHQPADLREGFVNAYNVVTTGLGDTAWDLYQAAATDHEEYGVTGAVGGVLRHLPGNIVRPIIFASEATRHVLGGVKNQFVPEAKKEASEKWKTNQ